jgi:hypothetical protein
MDGMIGFAVGLKHQDQMGSHEFFGLILQI